MSRQFNIRSAVLPFLVCLFHLYYANAMECGKVQAMQYQILEGNEAGRGQWPFIVILYNVKRAKYICGGTLISKKHILTAAHCIQKKFDRVRTEPQDLLAYLGSHDLTKENDPKVVRVNISEIHVHDDWKPFFKKHDADLAILVLNRAVTFTEYILPICLPADSVEAISATIDVSGTIVGWGFSDDSTNFAKIPRFASLRALNDSFCHKMDSGLRTVTSERTFCGGFGDGIPNHGDSGGGFFVESEYAWVQYGIVSTIRTNATNHVIPDSISVYTNVRSFKKWIVDTVKRVGGSVGEESTSINLTVFCHYDPTYTLYGCVLEDLDIQNENTLVTRIQTLVAPGKLTDRVDALMFRDGSMATIPNGLGFYFENLKILEVNFDVSLILVRRPNFFKMGQLEEVKLFSRDIKWVDEDSLWDLPNLKRFMLVDTKVVALEENLFEKNEKLAVILLGSNKLETLPKRLVEKNLLLEIISIRGNLLNTVDEDFFEFNGMLSIIDLSSNQLGFLSRHLLKNNLQLQSANFSNNFLKTIDELTFEKNEKLAQILMSSNQLESLPKDLLKNNFLLQIVDFSNNFLNAVDELTFEKNEKLVQLLLSSNQLESLPKDLLKNNLLLKIVDFSNNFLKTIDDSIFGTNTELLMVRFANNNLEILTRNLLQNNTELAIVNFDENSIHTIDEETFQSNSMLREVRLRSNQIEFLPRNLLKNNSILVEFWLGENLMKSIDEHFLDSNVELKIFEIEMNKIESLPANLLKNNVQLEYFVFENNLLRVLNEDFFATNVHLKEVYLSVNQLESLPKHLFKQNVLLQKLGLRKNFFTSIDGHLFETNTMLSAVDLSSNKLEYVPENLFDNNSLLEIINLDDNRLKFIEFDFTKLENVEGLTLQRNICIDSYLYDFTDIAEFQKFINANCSSAINV